MNGNVVTGKRVPAERREIDVYFVPNPQAAESTLDLGLLGRFATKEGLFEAFRNAATAHEIRMSSTKLYFTIARSLRRSQTKDTRIIEDELPFLWILSPTASESILNGFRAYPDEDNWGKGVYLFGDLWRGAIVVIHQLPDNTEETLWLRLLGRGEVQRKAIDQLEALPVDNPLRSKALNLLSSLRITLELKEDIDEEDRGLIMRLSPIYLQRLAEAEQKGRDETTVLYEQRLAEVEQTVSQRERQTVIENLLRARFGSLDDSLRGIVEALLILPPEEFTPLLLELSREELLTRFGNR